MSRLTELALRYVRRDQPLRALVATAGDGKHLVDLADAFAEEARYGAWAEAERAASVLSRLRAADLADGGAIARISAWAEARDACADGLVAFGDPLASFDEPQQSDLFTRREVPRPPATFAEAPYDLVIADVPRRDLDAATRDWVRSRYASATGNFTAEVPFVERLLALVSSEGVIALRVRAAIVRREFGRGLVDELGRRARLLSVEREGEWLYVALRRADTGDGATLLRVFGSEGAAKTLRAIHAGSRGPLRELVDTQIGCTSSPGFDDVWLPPVWLQARVPTMPYVRGGDISFCRVHPADRIVWPYDEHGLRRSPPDDGAVAWLAQFRPLLESREVFGQNLGERNVRWYEYLEHHAERWGRVPALVMARNASSPRVAVLRRAAVVGPSALLIHPKDPEDLHFIRGVLSSRLGAFWMRHVFHVDGHGARSTFQVTAVGLERLPLAARTASVVAASEAIERVARSIQPAASAIAGEPDRLAARLDATFAKNRELVLELAQLQDQLDLAVLRAYGVDPESTVGARILSPEHSPDMDWSDDEDRALLDWLVAFVSRGFSTGELDVRRPIGAADVADWLRLHPLAQAVLNRLALSVSDVLMSGAVPFEIGALFSPNGVRKLGEWSSGQPSAFRMDDYAGRALETPSLSVTRLRAAIWRWRGRYNVPREPFAVLEALSRQSGEALFAWSGTDAQIREGWARSMDAAADGAGQVDIERLLRLKSELSRGESTTAELADALFGRGWSTHDVEFALRVLERSGQVVANGERWSLV